MYLSMRLREEATEEEEGGWVCVGVNQTPSTGLRHPSFLEEGAGKRCSECGGEKDSSRVPILDLQSAYHLLPPSWSKI